MEVRLFQCSKTSGLRTRELREINEGMDLKVYSMPRYFDVLMHPHVLARGRGKKVTQQGM